jgi:hypothetical protein
VCIKNAWTGRVDKIPFTITYKEEEMLIDLEGIGVRKQ